MNRLMNEKRLVKLHNNTRITNVMKMETLNACRVSVFVVKFNAIAVE